MTKTQDIDRMPRGGVATLMAAADQCPPDSGWQMARGCYWDQGFKIITPDQLGISIRPPHLEPLELSRIWVKSEVEPQTESLPFVMLVTCPQIVDTGSPETLLMKAFLLTKLNGLSFR